MSVFFRRRGKAPPILDAIFSNNSWEKIIAACQSRSVPDSWVIGNSKTMTINGKDYQIDIIGKNHDTYAAGGKAPLTFQTHDCYSAETMNNSDTNDSGWKDCRMRKSHLPDILALMPSEVQTAIREVKKLTSAGSQSTTINATVDKLFLLAEVEIFGSTSNSVSGEGTQYAYYKAGNSKIKNASGADPSWWTRSPNKSSIYSFCYVNTTGNSDTQDADYGIGVAFAFCF